MLIAVHNSFDSYTVPELEVKDCELKWVKVKLNGGGTLYMCAYYMPDDADEPSLRKVSLQMMQMNLV